MAPEQDDSQADVEVALREIPRWVARYAQNRTLAVLVAHLLLLTGGLAFAGLGFLTVRAVVHEARAQAAACVVLLSALAVLGAWFSIAGRGVMQRVSESLYRGEGEVAGGPWLWAEGDRPPLAALLTLGFCSLVQAGLGLIGLLPAHYGQPVSALYAVPTMVWLGVTRAPDPRTAFMFLWPLLYGAHAVLILAGAPISRGLLFDMWFPVVGYGLIAAIAGHVYSRYALRRLRALAAMPGSDEQEE